MKRILRKGCDLMAKRDDDRKGISIRLPLDVYDDFVLSVTLRKDTMQNAYLEFTRRYIQETRELKEQGILKLL